MRQISEWVETVLLRTLDNAVRDRARLRPARSVREKPVLATYHERFHSALRPVVVRLDTTVLQKGDQLRPLIQAVTDRLAKRRLRTYAHGLNGQPQTELVQHRLAQLQTTGFALFRGAVVKLALGLENLVAKRMCRSSALVLRLFRQDSDDVEEFATGVRPASG